MCVNCDLLVGLSSLVIAICALGFTIWQTRSSIIHDKLSVKPYLSTWRTLSEDYLAVKIHNNGLGPAKIKSFGIYVDGQKITGMFLEPHKKALAIVFQNYQFYFDSGTYLGVGYMMPANQEKDLVAIRFTGEKKPTEAEVEHALKRARVVIKYESIYKEEETLDSHEELQKQLQ